MRRNRSYCPRSRLHVQVAGHEGSWVSGLGSGVGASSGCRTAAALAPSTHLADTCCRCASSSAFSPQQACPMATQRLQATRANASEDPDRGHLSRSPRGTGPPDAKVAAASKGVEPCKLVERLYAGINGREVVVLRGVREGGSLRVIGAATSLHSVCHQLLLLLHPLLHDAIGCMPRQRMQDSG